MKPSVSTAARPTHAVITSSPKYGYGVYSWHTSLQSAQENARETGGVLVPVDYLNGELLVPSLATRKISDFFFS